MPEESSHTRGQKILQPTFPIPCDIKLYKKIGPVWDTWIYTLLCLKPYAPDSAGKKNKLMLLPVPPLIKKNLTKNKLKNPPKKPKQQKKKNQKTHLWSLILYYSALTWQTTELLKPER